jgi:hypothetical protein
METILNIIGELKYLEGLVKLTRIHNNEEHIVFSTNVITQQLPTCVKLTLVKITEARSSIVNGNQ